MDLEQYAQKIMPQAIAGVKALKHALCFFLCEHSLSVSGWRFLQKTAFNIKLEFYIPALKITQRDQKDDN